MRYSFFSTTRSQNRSTAVSGLGTAEESVETGAKSGSSSLSHPYFFNIKLRKNTKAIDDLQMLLDKIYLLRFDSIACMNYMKELVNFFSRHAELINQVPSQARRNQFNALELILTIGETSIAKQLLKLGAEVRPKHRSLYEVAAKLRHSKDNKFASSENRSSFSR